MQYGKMILKDVPMPIFAHIFESAHYDYPLPKMENTLELTFIEQGAVNVYQEGLPVYKCVENSLLVNYNKKDIRCRSDAPLHRHVTVGLALGFEVLPVSKEHIIACSRETGRMPDEKLFAILPLEWAVMLSPKCKIRDLLYEIAHLYPNNSVGNRLLLESKIMKLFFEITQECVRQILLAGQIPPGNILYAQRVMEYVSEHIREKILVEDIAKSVGLSGGYLSNVFKSVTGQTLTEYINRTKLQLVKDFVLNGKMSFSQAGEYVGILDSSYLSRLFRKYLGATIRELKSEHNVISE